MQNTNQFEIPCILNDFLNYLQVIKGKSKNTVQVYFYDLRMFFRFLKIYNRSNPTYSKDLIDEFDKIDISDITIDYIKSITLTDLYAYMSFISNELKNSPSSRARKVASLKSFFNYQTNKTKLLVINPTSELESPKLVKRLPRYLNIEESKKLLSSVNGKYSERDFAMLTLFLNCGIRLSELININIMNINENKLLIIGKGNKERSIHLNISCVEAINDYLKVRSVNGVKDKDALFLSKLKKRISKNMVQHIVKKYIKESGLDPQRYSTHKLRHTAATLMYKHGKVDIRALQKILGHETIATTEIYTHLDNQQIKDALDSNPLNNWKSS